MIGKEFEKMLAEYTRSAADMDLRIRGLRGSGHLPSIRGRHSPDINAEQAALMLLSLVSARAVEGGEVYGYARAVCKGGSRLFVIDEATRAKIAGSTEKLDDAFRFGFDRLAVFSGGLLDALAIELADGDEAGEIIPE